MESIQYFFLIAIAIINFNEAYITEHYDVNEFDVDIRVKYDTDCSSKVNFSTIVTVPRGSSILNVLEYANQNYPTFNGFKVAFTGALNGAYQVVCINGNCADDTCVWKVLTDPITTAAVPINEVFVSNIGMIVHFVYTNNANIQGYTIPKQSPLVQGSGSVSGSLNGYLNYTVQYVSPCMAGIGSPSTPYTVSYIMGESALNVMERAALKEPVHNFVLSNIFGRFYVIHTFNDQPTTQSCLWCVYYSPSSSGTPSYHITSDINNFIVPLPQGSLKIKYEASCGNSAVNALSRNNLANVPLPVPPHFNPFL
jgi:hypothetical protein